MSAPSDVPAGAVCPRCGKALSPRYAPFCSRRCADLDLGRWLKGAYVIPGPPEEEAHNPEGPPEDQEESPQPDDPQAPDGEGK